MRTLSANYVFIPLSLLEGKLRTSACECLDRLIIVIMT